MRLIFGAVFVFRGYINLEFLSGLGLFFGSFVLYIKFFFYVIVHFSEVKFKNHRSH